MKLLSLPKKSIITGCEVVSIGARCNCQVQGIEGVKASSFERLRVSLRLIRDRQPLSRESQDRNSFAPTLLVRDATDLELEHLGAQEPDISSLYRGQNCQDRLSLDFDLRLSLVIKWSLKAAIVEIDSHLRDYIA